MSDVLEHPDDRLSALLDGELSAAEAAVVDAHVIGCADCSAELDAVRAARTALRSLPAVEPPPGFLERLLEGGLPDDPELPTAAPVVRLSPRRLAAANAAAALVAGVILAAGFGGTPAASAVAPDTTGALRQHSAAVSAASAGVSGQLVGLAPSPRVGGRYHAPQRLAGYELVEAFAVAGGVQLLYERGPYRLSVIEQVGEIDRDRLPEGPLAGGRVVVVERGDLVVTVVGDESAEAVEAAVAAFPGADDGEPFGTRARRACGKALELLSPAG